MDAASGEKGWNRNVIITFAYRCSFALSIGLWSLGNFSTYVYLLEDRSSQAVGWTQGIQGTCVALAALPAGWMADRSRRDHILKYAGIAQAASIIGIVLGVELPKQALTFLGLHTDTKFVVFCIALALYGCSMGISQSAVEAILGDSVPTGSRTKIYNVLFSSMCVAAAIGPLISAVVFLTVGNNWDLEGLGRVVLVGMLVSIVPTVTLFLFDDERSLGIESEGLLAGQAVRQAAAAEQREDAKREMTHHRRCGLSVGWLPYLLCTSDCLAGLGSGMTIKYFPIWLYERIGLSPSAVNFVQTAAPFAIAAAAMITQHFAKSIGRVQSILLVRLIAIALLLVMALWRWSWSQPLIILPVYVLRFAMANCTYAISKSILNDYVPKESRARWNSVESIMQFGWSGSAVLGGIIIDKSSYVMAFLVTAIVQFVSCLVVVLLLPLVPVKEQGVFDDGALPAVAEQLAAAESAPAEEEQDDASLMSHRLSANALASAMSTKDSSDLLHEPLLASSPP